MRTDEIIKKLQKNIKTQLSHKDLISLCTFMNTPVSGRKTYIQDKLVEFIQNQSYDTLTIMSNKIDDFLRIPPSVRPRQMTPSNRPTPEALTDTSLRNAPINLEDEVPPNFRIDLSFPIILPQMYLSTRLPTHPIQGGVERSIELPNMMLSTPIATSPFYCCSVCLHPLTLMKPQFTPNCTQSQRTTCRFNQNFIITENAKTILSRNQYMSCNKVENKWQILMRFVGIDSNKLPTNPQEKVTETIPPYLIVTVNGISQPLWDILPSNSKQKEGKRHAKAVHISDKLIFTNRTNNGYSQSINITWWQTPSVYMYYYVGIYLERKLTVKEVMTLYTPNSPFNNRSMEETLKWIENKLGIVSKTSKKDEDDDLVISNVLPINLCCPVGKSRIVIPLRTVSCQHLQCFDAHLFLSMNERRPVWKCPVCDSRATPDDLFCDKYFQKILTAFKDDDDATDVNVHPDSTFVAMKRNKDREQVEKPKINENSTPILNLDQSEQDLIVLDSDEETEPLPPRITMQQKAPLPPKDVVSPKTVAPQPPPYSVPIAPPVNKELPVEKDQSLSRVNNTVSANTLPVLVSSNIFGSNEIENRNTSSILTATLSKSQSNQISNGNQGNIFTSVTRPNLATNVPISSHVPSFVPTVLPKLLQSVSQETPKTTPSTIPISIRSNIQSNSFMTCAIAPLGISNSLSTPQNPPTTNTYGQSAFGNTISVIGSKFAEHSHVSSTKLPIPAVSSDTCTSKKTTPEISNSHKERFGTRKSNDVDISKDFSIVSPPATPLQQSSSLNPFSLIGNSAINSHPIQSVVRTPSLFTSQKSDSGSTRIDSLNDVVDDVVRTLPVSNMPDLSSKNRISDNQSPEPIVCPNVIIQLPEKKQSKPDNIISPCPSPPSPGQIKKIENQKKSKMIQSKIPPPATLVPIPSVTIDLTEEDDEVQQSPPINLKPSSLLASKAYSWLSVNAPIPSNLNSNSIQNSKIPFNNYSHFITNKDKESKKLSAIGIGHFKPHQMRFNNNIIPTKANKTQCPIDLTGDDDDEDHLPSKRQRINHIDDAEDGQVEDSEEDGSPANNSPPVIANNSSSLNRNIQKNPCHVVSKKKL